MVVCDPRPKVHQKREFRDSDHIRAAWIGASRAYQWLQCGTIRQNVSRQRNHGETQCRYDTDRLGQGISISGGLQW
jgi:hypothetical protein